MYRSVQAIYGIKGNIIAKIHAAVAEELIEEGQRLVDTAGDEGTYKNITGNLRTSIGSCLFVDGKEYKGPTGTIEEYSRRYYNKLKNPYQSDVINSGENRARIDPETGEEIFGSWAINRFFDEYEKAGTCPKGKWQLVVAVAMFYGAFVERKGYKVISFVGSDMYSSEVAKKYKGVVKNVPNKYDLGGGLG